MCTKRISKNSTISTGGAPLDPKFNTCLRCRASNVLHILEILTSCHSQPGRLPLPTGAVSPFMFLSDPLFHSRKARHDCLYVWVQSTRDFGTAVGAKQANVKKTQIIESRTKDLPTSQDTMGRNYGWYPFQPCSKGIPKRLFLRLGDNYSLR